MKEDYCITLFELDKVLRAFWSAPMREREVFRTYEIMTCPFCSLTAVLRFVMTVLGQWWRRIGCVCVCVFGTVEEALCLSK